MVMIRRRDLVEGTRYLRLDRLQGYIDDGNSMIRFPRGSRIYRLKGLQENLPCEEHWDKSTQWKTENKKWLDIGDNHVKIRLNGNRLVFPDGFFGFKLSGGSLSIDLGGGTLDGGLKVAKVLDWCKLDDPDSILKLDDASFFRVGDNISSSFSQTNGSSSTHFCYLTSPPSPSGEISDRNYKVNKDKEIDEDHPPILPPNSYVSNVCYWGAAPTLQGHGKFTLKNGFVEDAQSYFSCLNGNPKHELDVEIIAVKFSGQYLDGLTFGAAIDAPVDYGNINAKLYLCSFGKSYDIGKQGIIWNSVGNLLIDRCHFARGNRDADLTHSEKFRQPHVPSNSITIKYCVFDGKKYDFQNTPPSDDPLLNEDDTGREEIRRQFFNSDQVVYLNDDCLNPLQLRQFGHLKVSECLLENYERQMLLIQRLNHPFEIDTIDIQNCQFDRGAPIAITLYIDNDKSIKANDSALISELEETLKGCELKSVNIENCRMTNNTGISWGLVSEVPNTFLFSEVEKQVKDKTIKLSKNISFVNCSFERLEKEGSHSRTRGDITLKDCSIINRTSESMSLGHPGKLYNLNVRGDFKVLIGDLELEKSTNASDAKPTFKSTETNTIHNLHLWPEGSYNEETLRTFGGLSLSLWHYEDQKDTFQFSKHHWRDMLEDYFVWLGEL